jgi:hypothetical protein
MVYHIDILAGATPNPTTIIRTIRLEAADVPAVSKRLQEIMRQMPGWAPRGAGFQVRENGRVVHTWFEDASQ